MSRPRGVFLGILACLLIVALSKLDAPAQELTRRPVFDTILKYYTCGQSQRQNYVITDRQQWEAVWLQAMSNSYPVPPAPDIDFDRQSVIAVFEGDQPSSGYSYSINKLVKSGKQLKVCVEEVIPEDACRVLLVVTQPVHIIVTEKVADPDRVRFKIKQKITVCSPNSE